MAVLAVRFALILLFGIVLIYVPVHLFAHVPWPLKFGAFQLVGGVVGVAGALLALWCVSDFALAGRGTPAPFAPPSRLVTRGPYRHLRNPMYLGVGLFLAGTALFYQSLWLAGYTTLFFSASHLFVVWYEERTLRQKFGREYDAYCSRINRWRPRL